MWRVEPNHGKNVYLFITWFFVYLNNSKHKWIRSLCLLVVQCLSHFPLLLGILLWLRCKCTIEWMSNWCLRRVAWEVAAHDGKISTGQLCNLVVMWQGNHLADWLDGLVEKGGLKREKRGKRDDGKKQVWKDWERIRTQEWHGYLYFLVWREFIPVSVHIYLCHWCHTDITISSRFIVNNVVFQIILL